MAEVTRRGWARGDVVDVVIRRATVVDPVPGDPRLVVEWRGDDGVTHSAQIDARQGRILVIGQMPADGVPRPGDVWADDAGRHYMARWMNWRARPEVVLVDTDGVASGVAFTPWLEVFQHRGLRLVWRPSVPPPRPAADLATATTAVLAVAPAGPAAEGCTCPESNEVGLIAGTADAWIPDPLCPVHGHVEGVPLGGRHG